MQILNKNLWEIYEEGEIICITTNGSLKKNGEAVMGAGCAKEAAAKFPWLPKALGEHLVINGNVVGMFGDIITFPVKHNWYENADINLIKESYDDLLNLVDCWNVYLPRPGCGNGHLSWETVKEALLPIHRSNVIFVDYKEK